MINLFLVCMYGEQVRHQGCILVFDETLLILQRF